LGGLHKPSLHQLNQGPANPLDHSRGSETGPSPKADRRQDRLPQQEAGFQGHKL
jgi:hypothetical protein